MSFSLLVVLLLVASGQPPACFGRVQPCQARCASPGDAAMPAESCWDVIRQSGNRRSGFYWLKTPSSGAQSGDVFTPFRAYCDMTTEGGGWTLVARITDDYSWMCADRNGGTCPGSSASPLQANLWHEFHSRLSVAPEFIARGLESGVHLPLPIVRSLFVSGFKSIRFSFYQQQNLTAPPTNDAIAQFHSSYNMFKSNMSSVLVKGTDYRFHVLRHGRPYTTAFTGKQICWLHQGSNLRTYNYEDGLYMGTASTRYVTSGKDCHLANAGTTVQLKSHMMRDGGWYGPQHSLLTKGTSGLQVAHKAIQIWVR